jgi:WD40 repeat protein
MSQGITSAAVHISSLPRELLIKTVSFLSPKNIACLLTVSKDWYQHLSSNDLWRELCPRISMPTQLKDRFYLTCYLELTGIRLACSARKGELKVLSTLWGSGDGIDCLKVTDKAILTGSYCRSICIWDRSLLQKDILEKYSGISAGQDITRNKITFLQDLSEEIVGLDVMDNNFVILSFGDKNIYVKTRSDESLALVHTLVGHTQLVTCVKVSDKSIISGSDDKTIRIWNEAGQLQKTLEGHKKPVTCLQVVDNTIISGSEDKTIGIWDRTQDLLPKFLSGHEGVVTCLKVTDTAIVSGSEDKTLRIWDRLTSTLQYVLKGHTEGVVCLEVIDNTIISCAKDDTMRIWDLSTGNLLQTYPLKEATCMSFVDNTLIMGCRDGGIQAWVPLS